MDLALTFFLVRLMHFFTVDNYISTKKINVSPVTIVVFYSFGEDDFLISYCTMFISLLYYKQFEKNVFVNYGCLR